MVAIEESILVQAPPGAVWEVVSDLDSEPKFWSGTKSIRTISRDGNTVRREIIIAFRDQKCIQDVTIHPKDRIEARFVKGIIDGRKDTFVTPDGGGTLLRVAWDIKLTGMMSVFNGMITGHIKKGTMQALESIKKEAEGKRS